jgi:hypothetical protein
LIESILAAFLVVFVREHHWILWVVLGELDGGAVDVHEVGF